MFRTEGKLISLIVFGLVFILLAVNTEAAWWNPVPRCDTINIFGLCCVDDCLLGQVKCRNDRESAWQCGDYDTINDFDQCYEFPPESEQDTVQTCPFGCELGEITQPNYISPYLPTGTGDICVTTDPCQGQGCNPGDTRCGRKCRESTSCAAPGDFVDAMYMCKKITAGGTTFDCYGWDFQDANAMECPFGCDAQSGECLTQNQRDCSTCTPEITECDVNNFYVRDCLDENQDGCFHLEQDQSDWKYCPNGCAEDYSIDGRAYCKDAGGQTDCNDCLFGSSGCNPSNLDYMQWCWESDIFGCKSWTTDYSRFVEKFGFDWHAEFGQYCEFGCHLGKCRANPEPDVPDLDACVVNQTRCGGDGSYIVFCEEDQITGNLVWGNQKKCLSGKCQNGECVKPTGKGYETITEGIPADLEIITTFNMATDGRFFYITALVNPDGSLRHTLITLTSNASYVKHCFLNETGPGGGVAGGLTVIGEDIYMASGENSVTVLDSGCNNKSTISLNRNITGALPFFASNSTHLFIEANTTDGVNVYDLNGNFQYSICLIEDTFTICRDNHEDMVQSDGRLYIINEDSNLEIYGIDGYFFGDDTLEVPEGFSGGQLLGIAAISDRLYMLWAKTVENRPSPGITEFETDYLISVYFLDRSCQNSCNERGSRCVGLNKEFVSRCIETPDGCFKYFDEVNHLFPAGTADDFMDNCGLTQCKERWENNFIKLAFCDDDVTCEDVCEPGQIGCDAPVAEFEIIRDESEGFAGIKPLFTGSRYKVKCILKDSPVPFNLGRQCFGWADPFDAMTNSSLYEFCGQSHTCVDGQCVPKPNECFLNESHCEKAGNNEFQVPCDIILGINQWSWGNRTLCEWGCSETFNETGDELRTASCKTPTIEQNVAIMTKNAVMEFNEYWIIMWSDPGSQLFIMLILMVAAFIVLLPGGWQLSAGGSIAVFLAHIAVGWLGGAFLFAILLILAIFILPKIMGGE